MYILVHGAASVFKQTTEGELYRVTILNGTDHAFFGEGALLDADSRSATIRADLECICLVLDRESFEKFGKQYPPVGFSGSCAHRSRGDVAAEEVEPGSDDGLQRARQ